MFRSQAMPTICAKCAIILFFMCSCATIAAGESDSIIFPEEEEIYEAYQEGLIDFDEYSRLKEIAARLYPNREDTLYVRLFPDLLAGPASLLVAEEPDVQDETTAQVITGDAIEGAYLFRRYQNLRDDSDHKWLNRVSLQRNRLHVYGAFNHEYSGRNHWERRYVDIPLAQKDSVHLNCIAGNYNYHMGMGVIYGYHGRLFSHSSTVSDADKFLFPDFGGGNGCLLTAEFGPQNITLLFDVDKNEDFEKSLAALSWTIRQGQGEISVNGLYGGIGNRIAGGKKTYTLVSLSGRQRAGRVKMEFETAMAPDQPALPIAGTFDVKWRRGSNSFAARGWHYDRSFPALFSGGPSARRYKATEVEDLGFSFRDRWSGESGGLITSCQRLTEVLSLSSAILYSQREPFANRLEYRIGLKRKLSGTIRGELNCYWRGDNLYSENQTHRRIQAEMTWTTDAMRVRMVGGHRHEPCAGRNDYVVFTEARFKERMGQFILHAKLDRVVFTDMKNSYTYFAVSHDAHISDNLHIFAKYSYRYRRRSTTGTYGQLRWDMEWTF